MHALDDAGSAAHEQDLGFGFHGTAPVDQCRCIDQFAVDCLAQHIVCLCRVIIVLHLDADTPGRKTTFGEQLAQMIHRVALGRHDIVVGIRNDVVMRQIAGALRSDRIHAPAPEDRVALGADDDALMDIEAPPVIAGQPCHVRRIDGDQCVQPGTGHCSARPGKPVGVFSAGERQVDVGHGHGSIQKRLGITRAETRANRNRLLISFDVYSL